MDQQALIIDSFDGDFRFLSNFHPCLIHHDGLKFPSTEHAFQAAKTWDFNKRLEIATCPTPGRAKRMGREVDMRADWERVKTNVMQELVLQKFVVHADLGRKLMATGDMTLIEGNYWNDTFWGVCRGEGQNKLGIILMNVRNYLQNICR